MATQGPEAPIPIAGLGLSCLRKFVGIVHCIEFGLSDKGRPLKSPSSIDAVLISPFEDSGFSMYCSKKSLSRPKCKVQLWVRPVTKYGNGDTSRVNYAGLWKKCFPDWRKQIGEMDVPVAKKYNIDHIYSEERAAGEKYGYVRLWPVSSKVNKSHGAKWEKARIKKNWEAVNKKIAVNKIQTVKYPPCIAYASVVAISKLHGYKNTEMHEASRDDKVIKILNATLKLKSPGKKRNRCEEHIHMAWK